MKTAKERPILFSGPMVRAILDGRKTQTRRVVKPQGGILPDELAREFGVSPKMRTMPWVSCPYGMPGDLLWVRETFTIVPSTAYARSEGIYQIVNPSDRDNAAVFKEGFDRSRGGIRWKSPRFMPRWASRITLEITRLRVDRLQEISDDDCIAEGCVGNEVDGVDQPLPVMCYMAIWESINGAGSWDQNPWVWVIEFKRVEGKR